MKAETRDRTRLSDGVVVVAAGGVAGEEVDGLVSLWATAMDDQKAKRMARTRRE